MSRVLLDVALVHSPVVDKNGQEITSAITPTDLHDLARSSRTFGVNRFWVVTPLTDQQKIAGRMLGFWQTGVGADYNPNRGQALDLIRIVSSLDEAIVEAEKIYEMKPVVWATSANGDGNKLGYRQASEILRQGRPTMLLFGTAWGLAQSVIEICDEMLAPIKGHAENEKDCYNHLSVRSAAAIVLDRLMGRCDGE